MCKHIIRSSIITVIAVYSNDMWTVGELLKPTELSNTQKYQQLLWRRVREGQEIAKDKICRLQQELHQLHEENQHSLQQEESPIEHWVVARSEITMTDEILGKGGYGVVKVAKFRGSRVAAKCLHEMILSPYNLQLFTRELEIAARIRHPNLLLFIGATKEGSPIILSELMPTSLRKELEKAPLTHPKILNISRDVAAALNYLHLWKPTPIIHRDVSSPNVLLEPSSNNTWKAKLSDYGSANLLQQISPNSVVPGNPFYSAPEARCPRDHSPAMDVYSYGVLLTEMVLHHIPDNTPIEKLCQTIRWPTFNDLITKCITTEHQSRPSIANVLEQLQQM